MGTRIHPDAAGAVRSVANRSGGAGGAAPAGGLGVSPRFLYSSGRVGGMDDLSMFRDRPIIAQIRSHTDREPGAPPPVRMIC